METIEFKVIQAGFALLTVACLFLLFIGLWRGIKKTNYSTNKKRNVLLFSLITIIVFVVIVSLLSLNGAFSDFSSRPPKMFLVLLPTFLISLYLTFSGRLDAVLKAIPQSTIIYLQAFRIVVEILLWRLFVINLLPVQMTFEGLNWDVLSGITALLMGLLCHRNVLSARFLVVWNVFGLILLANIVTIAILSMPTPFRFFQNDPANTIVTVFPIVFLPTVLVPLAYNLHFFSIRKYFIDQKRTEGTALEAILE